VLDGQNVNLLPNTTNRKSYLPDPTETTQLNQLISISKVKFSKYNVNIIHVVKVMLNNVTSCKRETNEKYA